MSDSDYDASDLAQLLYTPAQANGVVVRKGSNGRLVLYTNTPRQVIVVASAVSLVAETGLLGALIVRAPHSDL